MTGIVHRGKIVNVESISKLTAAIGRAETEFPKTSCLLTGSAARKELRTFQESIQSDIDLLLVVEDEQAALDCRDALKALLQEVAREFSVEIACTITLQDQLHLRRSAGYVRSAAAAPPIWDHIGIAGVLKALSDQPLPQASGALGQPVSYYCAKALWTSQQSDWAKAQRAVEILSALLSDRASAPTERWNDQSQAETITRSAVAALSAATDLWPSSVYFLASFDTVSALDLYRGVRDRVFFENHGLEFQTAFVRG